MWTKNVWGIAEDRIRAHDKTGGASRQLLQNHREQTKRHSLWFLTKSCRCYAMTTNVNYVILILKLNLTSMRNIYIKIGLRWAPHTFFSHRSQIQFDSEVHSNNQNYLYQKKCVLLNILLSEGMTFLMDYEGYTFVFFIKK